MITLNHVLVPHDFGDTSKTAMDYAIALARMFNAVLDVLHVRDRAEPSYPRGSRASSTKSSRPQFENAC